LSSITAESAPNKQIDQCGEALIFIPPKNHQSRTLPVFLKRISIILKKPLLGKKTWFFDFQTFGHFEKFRKLVSGEEKHNKKSTVKNKNLFCNSERFSLEIWVIDG